MMQNYTQSRVTKVTKKQGWPQYLEFYFKHPDETNYQFVKKVHTFDEDQQKYISQQDWAESQPSHGIFDIEVKSGTALPFMKDRRVNLAMQLFDKGVIDQEALLEATDYPKADLIMKRMRQEAAAAAQAQAMMPQPQKGVK
jgi:hypothetical protein